MRSDHQALKEAGGMVLDQEAADAISLADLLTFPLDLAVIRRVHDLLKDYLARLPVRAQTGVLDAVLQDDSFSARYDLFRKLIEPAIVEFLLPALRRSVVRVIDAEAGELPKVTAAAEQAAHAFKRLILWLCHGGKGVPRAQALKGEIVRDFERAAAGLVDSEISRFGGSDPPDLADLSVKLLRLDVTHRILKGFGDPRALHQIALLNRRLAVATLDATTASLEAFLAKRDLLSMFDAVSVLSGVDALGRVLLAVVVTGENVGEERTSFVPTPDERALARFAAALGQLSDFLFTAAARGLGRPDANQTLFQGFIRQMSCILSLCQRFRTQARSGALDEPERQVRQRLSELLREIGVTLGAAADPPDCPLLWLTLEQARLVVDALDGERVELDPWETTLPA